MAILDYTENEQSVIDEIVGSLMNVSEYLVSPELEPGETAEHLLPSVETLSPEAFTEMLREIHREMGGSENIEMLIDILQKANDADFRSQK